MQFSSRRPMLNLDYLLHIVNHFMFAVNTTGILSLYLLVKMENHLQIAYSKMVGARPQAEDNIIIAYHSIHTHLIQRFGQRHLVYEAYCQNTPIVIIGFYHDFFAKFHTFFLKHHY